MEFAVIKTGGKQYKVSVGDSVKIEKITGEYKEGDKVTFDHVLLVDNAIIMAAAAKNLIFMIVVFVD